MFKDIQRRSRETFGLQRFDQRFLLDNRSASRVNQDRIGFHESQGIAINQVIAGGIQITIYRNKV